MDKEELKEHVEAVTQQIEKLDEVSRRCGIRFEHLSSAMKYATAHGHLREGEFEELEQLNRRANWAKHEGLGPADADATGFN